MSSIFLALLVLGHAARSNAEVTTDVVYGHREDGTASQMDIYRPENPSSNAAVIVIVSGAFQSGPAHIKRMELLINPLVQSGFTVFAVTHGNVGNYTIPQIYREVSAALEYVADNVARYDIDPRRIGVFGASTGGLLAGYLAFSDKTTENQDRKTRPAVAVIYAGPSTLRGSFPDLASISLVSADDPPTLFIHGDADTTVLISESEIMHEALKSLHIETDLVIIPGGSHTEAWDSEEGYRLTTSAMIEWFSTYLK